jgi:hypothetical protein
MEFWLLGVFLLLCVLYSTPDYRHAPDDYSEDPYITSWLSKAKARQIMRYHGANAIKITEDRVYIMRDARWICVYRDPSSLPEKDDREEIAATTVRVERERI